MTNYWKMRSRITQKSNVPQQEMPEMIMNAKWPIMDMVAWWFWGNGENAGNGSVASSHETLDCIK